MARKHKNTVDYFPHFVAAGKTLSILQAKYGNDGYACWFRLLETLAKSENHFIDLTEEIQRDFLAVSLQVPKETMEAILNDLATWKNIDSQLYHESKIIWCQDLVDNLSSVYANRRRNAPQKPLTTNNLRTETELLPVEKQLQPVEIRQSKGSKGSKVEEEAPASENPISKAERIYLELQLMIADNRPKEAGVKRFAKYRKKGSAYDDDLRKMCSHLAQKYPYQTFNGNLWDEMQKWLTNEKRFDKPIAGNETKPANIPTKQSRQKTIKKTLLAQLARGQPLDRHLISEVIDGCDLKVKVPKGSSIAAIEKAKIETVEKYLNQTKCQNKL